ncbi:endonuclease/exonuclease/phosphatase family protein [Leptospira kmetyi]|uniref:endonuclease/exonuclease/phosphatase family protein n=1 Tax=Leptospira kmetyi TaxID=408139 RepID=UPI001083A74D|nr:endonuclease/exonuclease/phosphatase family protein [Leptospira kmetyi]TGL68523.1 hypothetical protein EHQ67_11395 [Leptospira kmetyi]
MLKILFWNINQANIASSVASIALEYDVDLLLLAEHPFVHTQSFLSELNKTSFSYGLISNIAGTDRNVYFRSNSNFVKRVEDSLHHTVLYFSLPGSLSFTIIFVHLISKLHVSAESQYAELYKLNELILRHENFVNHRRTLLIGDLNMNPFESGLINSATINAVSSRSIALKGSRKVLENRYMYFYNPMWNLFGDRVGVPGTYYSKKSEHVKHFWNIFDQVLLRPDLIQSFRIDSLKIIDSILSTPLTSKRGIPLANKFSDHLPIYFELNI